MRNGMWVRRVVGIKYFVCNNTNNNTNNNKGYS